MRPTPSFSTAPWRTGLLLGLLLSSSALVQAQDAVPAAPAAGAAAEQAQQPLEGRQNQTIENIRVEDSGARVDEVRYGGVTQSISVQPKSAMPAYEVQPNDERRARQGDASGGSRVWNVLKF